MKALQCVELGMPDKLQVNEVPDPELIKGHVLIENKACSINFPDVLMIQGLYQFQPELPFIPGGESAGIVSAIGEGVEGINIGDRVFAMTGLGAFAEKTRNLFVGVRMAAGHQKMPEQLRKSKCSTARKTSLMRWLSR